jgi:hypothetical protein
MLNEIISQVDRTPIKVLTIIVDSKFSGKIIKTVGSTSKQIKNRILKKNDESLKLYSSKARNLRVLVQASFQGISLAVLRYFFQPRVNIYRSMWLRKDPMLRNEQENPFIKQAL